MGNRKILEHYKKHQKDKDRLLQFILVGNSKCKERACNKCSKSKECLIVSECLEKLETFNNLTKGGVMKMGQDERNKRILEAREERKEKTKIFEVKDLNPKNVKK